MNKLALFIRQLQKDDFNFVRTLKTWILEILNISSILNSQLRPN